MPRDSADTRDLLIDAGRRLFATRGVYATPLKTVVEAADQRNTSALHYHFGGREGLLAAIIDASNDSIETERKEVLDHGGDAPSLPFLVDAVVLPQAHLLHVAEGRQFLSIISQLADLFDRWEDGSTPAQALRAFAAIKASLPEGLDDALRHERVTRFLELVSEALGSRARQLEAGRTPSLAHDAWVANLTAMAVGALQAPPAALT